MMSDDFIKLVTDMREAQKNYFKLVTSKDAPFRIAEIHLALLVMKRAEEMVDRWLRGYKDRVRQLFFSELERKTDELSAPYNLDHDEKKDEGKSS